jgi:mRNA-degrading endonuclease RelE of RelBE toxin-antitoxin system
MTYSVEFTADATVELEALSSTIQELDRVMIQLCLL